MHRLMRSASEIEARHRGRKLPRTDPLSELPMVAALLVAAVLIAFTAASGPVLDLLAGLKSMWLG